MTKRERNIGICMVIVIVVWLVMTLSKDGKKTLPVTAPHVGQANQSAVMVPQKTDGAPLPDLGKLKTQLKHNAGVPQYEEMISPFEPIKKAEAAPQFDISKLDLMGVFFEQGVPNAIINDQMLRVGDEIMGCRVESITPNRVTVVHGAERFLLKLYPDTRTRSQTE
ncbi:MAG: hypothetical protein JW938_01730 [Candidatus Omnitrophica bacterium]|nr:hypothetical protein [Candidatus Omnitrophota bacterium]